MNTDLILYKYLKPLAAINRMHTPSLDAVELAFRLALDELAESIPSTDVQTTEELGAANLRIMELQADLERLQTATDAEVAELRQQIAQMDADNAALIRRNKELVDALFISENGTGLAVKNPPFVDPSHSNGADASAPSAIRNDGWQDDLILSRLDDIARDWWIGCAAGRHAWRTVPKPVQLRMVRHILSFGPETGSMKMQEFDAIKPDWMPGAGSHTKTLNLSWQQLNDWSVEL